jgi:Mn2+/Fe2+ NRAMP family transporter
MAVISTTVRRAPTTVLAVVWVVLGFVTLPLVALLTVTVVHRHGYDPGEFWAGAFPALVGYPVAAALWWYSRRHHGGWLLTALGVAVIIAVSWLPLHEFAVLVHLQWLETQPGGRGYQP